jgi:hypothetical protein
MRRLTTTSALAVALLTAGGCEDRSYRDIGGAISVLTRRNDGLVAPATAQLVSFGRRAIPQIEIALHTAPATGRLHLLEALAQIGDPEAVPILRHLAAYDGSADVRAGAEALLGRWAADASAAARAARARTALARVSEKRARGERP